MFVNQIFCEDCIETMERMIEHKFQVDYIITSPPYNTTRKGKVYNSQKARDGGYGRYDEYTEDKSNEEYIKWTLLLFQYFNRILSEDGVVLYNLSYSNENPELMWRVVYNILEFTDFTIADNIIWKKPFAITNGASNNKLIRLCEYIFVFCRESEFNSFKSNKRVSKVGANGQTYYHSIYNFIEAPNNDGKCDLNRATFSTDLILQLCDIYVHKDSVVYDPFIGSGTTANACKIQGIQYVGSEISEAQVKYARNRLNYRTLDEYIK